MASVYDLDFMSKLGEGIITIITAIIGVAIIAVIVSNQANTSGVLTAGGNALSSVLKTAVSPVSSGGLSI